MTQQHDLNDIKKVISESLEDFAGVVNRSIKETEQHLTQRLDGLDNRIDKLYSLVDGFVSLHQKLDQELTMLRARIERVEQDLQVLRARVS